MKRIRPISNSRPLWLSRRSVFALAGSTVALLSLAMLLWAADPPGLEERLSQHRNLGKAFYENPTTAPQAVAEFKKALDLAPHSNQEKLNYGLALLRAGKTAEALTLLQEVQRNDPKLPHTWFNLGVYYKKNGESERAIAQFEHMEALVPGRADRTLPTGYALQTGRTHRGRAGPVRTRRPAGPAAGCRALSALQHVPPGRPAGRCRRGAPDFPGVEEAVGGSSHSGGCRLVCLCRNLRSSGDTGGPGAGCRFQDAHD